MPNSSIIILVSLLFFFISCENRTAHIPPDSSLNVMPEKIQRDNIKLKEQKDSVIELSSKHSFTIEERELYVPQKKYVFICKNEQNRKILLFKTGLRVNTDGSPLSYHSEDFSGESKALNAISSAIHVYDLKNEREVRGRREIPIWREYVASGYSKFPNGYVIWTGVFLTDSNKGRLKNNMKYTALKPFTPCVISDGEYKGYYPSMTALSNTKYSSSGFCDYRKYVDCAKVPGFVIPNEKKNVLTKYGVQVGDLMFAYNTKNGKIVYGVINDSGPRGKLGEGSIALNMALKGIDKIPKNYSQVKKELDIDFKNDSDGRIIIGILPKTKKYKMPSFHTKETGDKRVADWLNSNGFSNSRELISFINVF